MHHGLWPLGDPPPHPVKRYTDTGKNITFPQLCWQTVRIAYSFRDLEARYDTSVRQARHFCIACTHGFRALSRLIPSRSPLVLVPKAKGSENNQVI